MSYLVTQEKYGRTETIVDVPRFAADLAAQLGGKMLEPGEDIDYRKFTVGPDLGVTVYSNRYGSKGRVFVRAFYPSASSSDMPYQDGRGTYKMPEATVSAERPMAVVARDVKRRVVEAAAEPIANVKRYVEQRKVQRSDLATAVAELAEKVPELRPANNGAASDGYSQTLYGSGKFYMQVRAYATGEVGIDRMGNVPLAAFVEIAEVLRKYATKKEG